MHISKYVCKTCLEKLLQPIFKSTALPHVSFSLILRTVPKTLDPFQNSSSLFQKVILYHSN